MLRKRLTWKFPRVRFRLLSLVVMITTVAAGLAIITHWNRLIAKEDAAMETLNAHGYTIRRDRQFEPRADLRRFPPVWYRKIIGRSHFQNAIELRKSFYTGPVTPEQFEREAACIAMLPSLQAIDLDRLVADGTSLDVLAKCKQLRTIKLSRCRIENLNRFPSLPKLQSLELSMHGFVQVDTHLFRSIGKNCPMLRSLSITLLGGKFTGEHVFELRGLRHLRSLEIRPFPGKDLNADRLPSGLRALCLRFSSLQDRKALGQEISKLEQLDRLVLFGSPHVGDETVSGLSLPKLTSLDLAGTSVGTETFAFIVNGRFPALRHLNLSGTNVCDDRLSSMPGLSDLESLKLTRAKAAESTAESALAGEDSIGTSSLPKLTSIWLRGTDFGDTSLALLVNQRPPNLRRLWLTDTNVTDDGLSSLLKLSKLDELYLEGTKATREGVLDLHKKIWDKTGQRVRIRR